MPNAEANAIAPGKSPLSSMTPTFVESDQGVAILGTPGGSRIITMVLLGVCAARDPLLFAAVPLQNENHFILNGSFRVAVFALEVMRTQA